MAILSTRELFVASICFSCSYMVALLLHRLYFGPLAKFPGPKLAAATLWYEYYYDVVKRGRYTWKIIELHKQYGRIPDCTNPHALFVNIHRSYCPHQSI